MTGRTGWRPLVGATPTLVAVLACAPVLPATAATPTPVPVPVVSGQFRAIAATVVAGALQTARSGD